MGHAHGHAAKPGLAANARTPADLAHRRADTRRRMWIALAINASLVVAEVAGGIVTGSLAVLADAGHLLSDVGAIAIGLFAASMAGRAGGSRRTFGFQRGEVLAALVNGITLIVIAVLIVVAAIGRLSDPPDVEGLGILLLGALGLAGNVAATWVLARGQRTDINLEGVLRHSFADALGSVGVVVAGIVVLATGWQEADPIASILIAVLILASSVRLIREPLDVLMEAAPPGLDPDSLARELCAVEGVRSVHDLHVWTVTPGFETLSAHVVVDPGTERDELRRRLEARLGQEYGIGHTTLQMEEEAEGGLLQVEGLEPRNES